MSAPRSSTDRSASRLSQLLYLQPQPPAGNSSDYEEACSEDRHNWGSRRRAESSPSGFLSSTPLSQQTPARSFYQRSFHGSLGKVLSVNISLPHIN